MGIRVTSCQAGPEAVCACVYQLERVRKAQLHPGAMLVSTGKLGVWSHCQMPGTYQCKLVLIVSCIITILTCNTTGGQLGQAHALPYMTPDLLACRATNIKPAFSLISRSCDGPTLDIYVIVSNSHLCLYAAACKLCSCEQTFHVYCLHRKLYTWGGGGGGGGVSGGRWFIAVGGRM